MNESLQSSPSTFTDHMRVRFKKVLDRIGGFLNQLGIAPNTITLVGLAGHFAGAIFLARGQFFLGGLIILLMSPVDALDGTMARLRGEPSRFGAFIDSVTDRYSEFLMYGGLILYYASVAETLMVGFSFVAIAGSLMVSYARARGEGLDFSVKRGLLTRLERYMVIIPSLVLGYPRIGILLVAVLANITALQRILEVRRQSREQ